MTAAKHTDPIVGMDQHLVQPPGPVPPIMVPIPVAGMVMDPADYQEGTCSVYINGLPRARAGNVCMLSPPHVPIGGVFVKPPLSEAELAEGSSTVLLDGEVASAMGHQVLGCHDIGAPAPTRPWKGSPAKSLMKAGSFVLAIPGGSPVMIGGSPTTSATRQIEEPPPSEWLDVEVVDTDGNPVRGARYELTLADGTKLSGVVSDEGRIAMYRVPAGDFTLALLP